MTFSQFLIESVSLTYTRYGLDLTNQHIGKVDVFVYTFFQNKDTYYTVIVDPISGEFGFGASLEYSPDPSDYTDDRTVTHNAISTFNKMYYVLLQIIKQYDIKQIKFEAANPSLGVLYKKLTTNKLFLDSLKANEFEYSGEIDGFFTYKRFTINK